MKTKRAILTALVFTILISALFLVRRMVQNGFFVHQNSIEKTSHLKKTQASYFFPLSISTFTRANLPCIPIQISEKEKEFILDLGFRGQFSFSSDFLKEIQNKQQIGIQKMYGIRGTEYQERLYKVPLICIGPISFFNPVLQEHDSNFHKDSTLFKEDTEISSPELGKVGWEAFEETNLFLDLKNSKIAFCDSLDTLKRNGYTEIEFTSAPFVIDRGLIEIQFQTIQGLLICALDTGSTWNVFNTHLEEGKSLEQAIQGSFSIFTYENFYLSSNDFGPLSFHRLPIKMPIQIDAILGMEFFKRHLVFLDFFTKRIYLAKNVEK